MFLRLARISGLAILLVSVSACAGGKADITGKITYKNAPVASGEIQVKSSTGVIKAGEIKADGTFIIKDVPFGTYQISVTCMDEEKKNKYFTALAGRSKDAPIGPDGKVRPKNLPPLEASAFSLIPIIYGDFAQSKLTVEVKDSKVVKDITLE